MANINAVYSGNYLKADDLGGRQVTVRINHVSVQDFEQGDKVEKKIVLGFEGKQKTLVVNKTNASIIAENLGSGETEDWIGQSISLAVRKVEFQGKLVPAIRVVLVEKPAAPTPTAQRPSKMAEELPPAEEGDPSVPF